MYSTDHNTVENTAWKQETQEIILVNIKRFETQSNFLRLSFQTEYLFCHFALNLNLKACEKDKAKTRQVKIFKKSRYPIFKFYVLWPCRKLEWKDGFYVLSYCPSFKLSLEASVQLWWTLCSFPVVFQILEGNLCFCSSHQSVPSGFFHTSSFCRCYFSWLTDSQETLNLLSFLSRLMLLRTVQSR